MKKSYKLTFLFFTIISTFILPVQAAGKDWVINFESNGGTGVVEKMEVGKNDNITLPNDPYYKRGYAFRGWKFKNKTPGYTYTINYVSNTSGAKISEPTTIKGIPNSQQMVTPKSIVGYSTPSNVWLTFDSQSNSYTFRYNPIRYNISYNLNGGQATNKTSYTIEDTFTLNNPTRTGYSFKGWSGTGISSYSQNVTISKQTGARSYTANWDTNSYTYNIIYQSSSGKQLGTTNVTASPGTSKTISAPDKNGYKTPAAQVVKFDSPNKTITFVYELREYAIIYNLEGGSISGQKVSYNVETPTFTLVKPTFAGNTFLGWTGSNGTSPQLEVSIPVGSTGNKTFIANYAVNTKTYNLIDGPTFNQKLKDIDTINNIKSIEFTDTTKPSNAKEIVGLDIDGDGGVVGWYETDINDKASVYISSQKPGQKVVANPDSSKMFAGFNTEGLYVEFMSNVEYVNVEKLDVSNVTNAQFMFASIGGSSLTFEIRGLENWDTSSIVNMNEMFSGVGYSATSWRIGNLSNWNVSKVTDMSLMFTTAGMSVSDIWDIGDLNKWDVSNVIDMSCMFNQIAMSSATINIKVANWNPINLENASGMFENIGYNNTLTVDLSGWNVPRLNNMSRMFHSNSINKIILPKNINPSAIMKGITNNTWYDETDNYREYPAGTIPTGNSISHTLVKPKPQESLCTLTFNPTDGTVSQTQKQVACGSRYGDLPYPELSGFKFDGWYTNEWGGEKVDENTVLNTDTTVYAHYRMATFVFSPGSIFNNSLSSQVDRNTSNLIVSIDFVDIPMPKTGVVEITGIDEDNDRGVVGWYKELPNGKRAVYFSSESKNTPVQVNSEGAFMFEDLQGVEYIKFNNLFSTKGLKNTHSMFSSTGALVKTRFNMDVSNFDMSQVIATTNMFSRTGLNAVNWFIGDLSSWNVGNVTDMGGMFSSAGSKTTNWRIGNLSNWNTSNVTDMAWMFNNAGNNSSNWSVGDISNWNTSNLISMHRIFKDSGINAIPYVLDLSGWDVSKVTDMSAVFNNIGANKILTPKNIQSNVILFKEVNSNWSDHWVTNETWYDITDNNKEYAPRTFVTGNGNVSHTLVKTLPAANYSYLNLLRPDEVLGRSSITIDPRCEDLGITNSNQMKGNRYKCPANIPLTLEVGVRTNDPQNYDIYERILFFNGWSDGNINPERTITLNPGENEIIADYKYLMNNTNSIGMKGNYNDLITIRKEEYGNRNPFKFDIINNNISKIVDFDWERSQLELFERGFNEIPWLNLKPKFIGFPNNKLGVEIESYIPNGWTVRNDFISTGNCGYLTNGNNSKEEIMKYFKGLTLDSSKVKGIIITWAQ